MKSYLTLSIVGALQGVFLFFYFFQKSRNQKAFLYLSLYVLIFSLGLLEDWLNSYGSVPVLQVISILIAVSSFLYGPLLYLFVYCITNQHPSRRKLLFHFLPFVIILIADIAGLLSGFSTNADSAGFIEFVLFELLMVQILIYNIRAIKLLNGYRKNIGRYSFNLAGGELDWLRTLIIIITATYIISFLLSHMLVFGVSVASDLFIIVQIAIIGSIYFMSYMVLFKPGVFEIILTEKKEVLEIEEPVSDTKEPGTIPLKSKYIKSGLKEDRAKQYLDQLEQLMLTEKTFKNCDLNVAVLAEKLGISKSHVTQVLNEQMGMTFFEYINMHRTREAKQLLADPEFSHLNIAGIAKEVGYKSKTTFFINFKKITGFSPFEWLKNEKQQGKGSILAD